LRPPFPPYTEKQRQQHLDEDCARSKEHGAIVTRHLQASTRLAEHLDWPGVAQVCKITRTRRYKGKMTVETSYAISGVPRHLADARRFAGWWRGHWGIENRIHWVRDIAFREDQCGVKLGNGPECLSIFRNTVIKTLRLDGVKNIASQLRKNAYQITRLLTKLGIMKN
jgi:predicted transposase YbfD/YdcC